MRESWYWHVGRISKFAQYFSHGVAADVSPRREPWVEVIREMSRGAAKEPGTAFFFRPIRGSVIFRARIARLTPWAIL